MASFPQATNARRRRAFGSWTNTASSSATRDSAMLLNPRAESFVPATPSKRKASSAHSTNVAPPARAFPLTQPPATTISSQVLFGQCRLETPDWTALESCLHNEFSDEDSGLDDLVEGDSEGDPDEGVGTFDLPVNALRRHYFDLTNTLQRITPHSAILVWLENRRPGSRLIRYLPLESNSSTQTPSSELRVQTNQSWSTASTDARSSSRQWPLGKLPVEIFELIANSLARDDVMAMRLVNHEFEDKVSRILFHTCVVPFNTELYDMIDNDAKQNMRAAVVGRSIESPPEKGMLHWLNAKEDTEGKVYKGHGLRVFQGFGPHIKRFGMSFEVDEDQLSFPPVKKSLDAVESYHGQYDWPPPYYTRFADLAGLERTADETSKMKAALSNLTGVKELALSIDNGLGWLDGPDHSIRARVLKGHSSVFESARRLPSQQSEAANTFWDALMQSRRTVATREDDPRESVFECRPLQTSLEEVLGPSRYTNTGKWPSIEIDRVMPESALDCLTTNDKLFGVLYSTPGMKDGQFAFDTSVTPSELRNEQKEWLLEMDWAQRAFLESYMLAVVDNSAIFKRVTTLNIAKLSSRFIRPLACASFWEALPSLEDVTLLISPDWRSVEKDEAGIAKTTLQYPSNAVDLFHSVLLHPRISTHPTIRRLKIGWIGGGEHAQGMYARNNHILPAPITQLTHSLAADSGHCLQFPNVEHLTLTNCWISPPTLEDLLQGHAHKKLSRLTLDSVSLTAHPNIPIGGGAAAAGAAVTAGGNAIMVQAPALQPQMQNAVVPPQPAPRLVQAGTQNGPNNAWHGANVPDVMAPAPLTAAQVQAQQLQQTAWWFANPAANAINMQPILFPPPPPPPPRPSHFTAGHRPGSWADLLNRHSPSVTLRDFLPTRDPWEEPFRPRPTTNLQTLEFKSCGYLLLNTPQMFDQTELEPDWFQAHVLSTWFRHRATALKPLMMDTRDPFLGRIAQCLTPHEENALQLAWGLTTGWQEHADDATWDGLKPGGTGRFSGIVSRGMGVVNGSTGFDDNE